MDEEVENSYQWSTNYGLKVISVNMQADYDAATLKILEAAREDDMEIRKATRMGAVQNAASAQEDPFEALSKFKKMLDAGLITQEDYDAKKKEILG